MGQEASVPEEDVHALLPQPVGAVVFRKVGPDLPNAPHDLRRVGKNVRVRMPERPLPPHGCGLREAAQGLGGNAPRVEAVAPQAAALHEGHAKSQRGGACRGDEPGRSTSHDDQVVKGRRIGILPLFGVYMLQKPPRRGVLGRVRLIRRGCREWGWCDHRSSSFAV